LRGPPVRRPVEKVDPLEKRMNEGLKGLHPRPHQPPRQPSSVKVIRPHDGEADGVRAKKRHRMLDRGRATSSSECSEDDCDGFRNKSVVGYNWAFCCCVWARCFG
jgi:hypothetical protein